MFIDSSPESAGIKSSWVIKFIEHLQRKGLPMHDIIIARGDKIVCEAYWKPFHKDFLHRQYSQTKSFVGVAIGLLEEEGKLNLDDSIADYFIDKIDRELPEFLKNQTIREMLKMTTSCHCPSCFSNEEKDRVRLYFNKSDVVRPSGTVWEYDSSGSQVLCVLAERLAKKPLLEYLKEKIFNYTEAFKNALILKSATGESWGDSAMLCTPRDMLSFGRFVLNYGTWEGKRLMNEKYLIDATSALVANNISGHNDAHHEGYGYQIWRLRDDSFGFVGMGQQLTICNPEKDIVFVCNSDIQGGYYPYDLMINYLFDEVIEKISEYSLPENEKAYSELKDLCDGLTLKSIKGYSKTPIQDVINGKIFKPVGENAQGITEFSLSFFGAGGTLNYSNAQGAKTLNFGINKNAFGKFPELGYSNEYGGLRTTDGFQYDCAASGAWKDDNKFQLHIQIIDKYFGNCTMTFAFKGSFATVVMIKTAEDFLNEYVGEFTAQMK